MPINVVKLFKITVSIIKRDFLYSNFFLVGNIVTSFGQIVSLGSIYPVVLVLLKQEDVSNPVLKIFNNLQTFFGLKVGLLNYLFVFVCLSFLSSLSFVIVDWYQNKFLLKLEHNLRVGLIEEVITSRWITLRKLAHGEFLSVIAYQSELYKIMVKYILLTISTAIQFVFLFVSLYVIDVQFAFLSVLLMGGAYLALTPMIKKGNEWSHERAEAFEHQTQNLIGASRAFKNIKTSSLETFLMEHLSPILYKVSNLYRKQMVLSTVQIKLSEVIGFSVLALLLFLGIEIFAMPIGKLLLALVLLTRIIPVARALLSNIHQAYTNLPSFDKIEDLRNHCLCENIYEEQVGRNINEIRFENISFGYNDGQNLFDSLSVTFKKGDLWAIAGPTGSGKTTILDLISGIIEPSSGDIFVDKQSYKDIDRTSLHNRVGYLTQDSFIFAGTVLENISWGQDLSNNSSIDKALKISQLEKFVKEKTINYKITENGQNLSGGQQQRIAIARLLLRDYDFLLMDEPSSAMDAGTERKFIMALSALKKNVGIIMVTHRKEYFKYADFILNIDNGIVEVLKCGDCQNFESMQISNSFKREELEISGAEDI